MLRHWRPSTAAELESDEDLRQLGYLDRSKLRVELLAYVRGGDAQPTGLRSILLRRLH